MNHQTVISINHTLTINNLSIQKSLFYSNRREYSCEASKRGNATNCTAQMRDSSEPLPSPTPFTPARNNAERTSESAVSGVLLS